MRKVHLYITSSIDGFIAREDGAVDWLFTEGDYGYYDFIKTVDTVIMGGATYRQVLTFGEWPYKEFDSIVITKDKSLTSPEQVEFISDNIPETIKELKARDGKDIWLLGGGQINTLFLNEGLIDQVWWFIHPVVLGSGLSLFASGGIETWFDVSETEHYNTGMVKIIYTRK